MELINNVQKDISSTLILLRNSPTYIAISSLIDIFFLFMVGFFGSITFSSARFKLQVLQSNSNSAQLGSLGSDKASAFVAEQTQKMIMQSKIVEIFIQTVIITALIILVLWIIFQGLNWLLATKYSKKELNIKSYYINFSLVSIIGFLFAALIIILFLMIKIKSDLGLYSVISESAAFATAVILLSLMSYFLLIGYSTNYKYNLRDLVKNILLIGIKGYRKLILSYSILFIYFLSANYILKLFFLDVNYLIFMITGLIFIMPILAFSRIYLIKSLEEII